MDGSFVWDLIQQYQIHELNKTADAVKDAGAGAAGEVKADMALLVERMDHMALICRAMWELLSEKTGLDDMRLAAKIAKVDLRDGKADGKITSKAKLCPSCGAMISPKFHRCLFCGHRDEGGDPFSSVA
jgi:hypothetical protein